MFTEIDIALFWADCVSSMFGVSTERASFQCFPFPLLLARDVSIDLGRHPRVVVLLFEFLRKGCILAEQLFCLG